RLMPCSTSSSIILSEQFSPAGHFSAESLVPAGQPSFLLHLREAARHVGVVGLAHHLFGHAEQDVILLEDMLAQQGDVLPGGFGKRACIKRSCLACVPHPAHAAPSSARSSSGSARSAL